MTMLTWRKGWVENINIHRDVHLRSRHSLLESFDNSRYTDTVYISSFDHREAASDVISQVPLGTHHRCSDASMDRCVTYQSFLVRYMQESAMVYSTVRATCSAIFLCIPEFRQHLRVVRDTTTKHFRIPGICKRSHQLHLRQGGC